MRRCRKGPRPLPIFLSAARQAEPNSPLRLVEWPPRALCRSKLPSLLPDGLRSTGDLEDVSFRLFQPDLRKARRQHSLELVPNLLRHDFRRCDFSFELRKVDAQILVIVAV